MPRPFAYPFRRIIFYFKQALPILRVIGRCVTYLTAYKGFPLTSQAIFFQVITPKIHAEFEKSQRVHFFNILMHLSVHNLSI